MSGMILQSPPKANMVAKMQEKGKHGGWKNLAFFGNTRVDGKEVGRDLARGQVSAEFL